MSRAHLITPTAMIKESPLENLLNPVLNKQTLHSQVGVLQRTIESDRKQLVTIIQPLKAANYHAVMPSTTSAHYMLDDRD